MALGCIVAFMILATWGGCRISANVASSIASFAAPFLRASRGATPPPPGADFSAVRPYLFVTGILSISVALASALMRKLFGQDDSLKFADDLLIAGVSLMPLGLALYFVSFLVLANYEVAAVLFVFAGCLTAIALFNGFTILGRVRDVAAAWSVPTTLVLSALLSAWLTKAIFVQVSFDTSPNPAPAATPWVFPTQGTNPAPAATPWVFPTQGTPNP